MCHSEPPIDFAALERAEEVNLLLVDGPKDPGGRLRMAALDILGISPRAAEHDVRVVGVDIERRTTVVNLRVRCCRCSASADVARVLTALSDLYAAMGGAGLMYRIERTVDAKEGEQHGPTWFSRARGWRAGVRGWLAALDARLHRRRQGPHQDSAVSGPAA